LMFYVILLMLLGFMMPHITSLWCCWCPHLFMPHVTQLWCYCSLQAAINIHVMFNSSMTIQYHPDATLLNYVISYASPWCRCTLQSHPSVEHGGVLNVLAGSVDKLEVLITGTSTEHYYNYFDKWELLLSNWVNIYF
jgi:hypothetical protein